MARKLYTAHKNGKLISIYANRDDAVDACGYDGQDFATGTGVDTTNKTDAKNLCKVHKIKFPAGL